jgi:excinuclease ABC subunit C
MRDASGRIIYIGKARSLKKRVSNYFRPNTLRRAHPKIRSLITSIADFDILTVKSEAEALLTEGKLIKEYRPYYNTLWKDDKRFLMIRIDLQHPYPTITKCRIRKSDGAAYFGPYTSGSSVNAAIEFLRRKFGIRRCRPRVPDPETYRHCSDDLIANCSAPCIGKIDAAAYRHNIEEACAFLRGERMHLLHELRTAMKQAAEKQDYEQAAATRDLLLQLQEAVQEKARVRKSPTMRRNEAEAGLRELKEALNLPTLPRHIECFDISHISGTHAVASMVAAIDGQPRPARYRRFRIKTVEGIDDPRSMAEVVRRRYQRLLREEKPLPDLVMVDGGITQLRAAKRALKDIGLDHLPIVGLAKRYEEIVWDFRENGPPLLLEKHSPALQIVTRLRDEAHRFAITYHRELRRKRIRESVLDEIPGIGEQRKLALLRHFGSLRQLAKASVEEISAVPGIGAELAQLIHAELHAAEKPEAESSQTD